MIITTYTKNEETVVKLGVIFYRTFALEGLAYLE